MARPVEIDRAEAFMAAYELFWSRGYISTSLNRLLEELGIGRSSFYAAFTSKEALFADVLAKYREQILEKFRRVRSKHQGVSALRDYLYQSIVSVTAAQRRKGCMAVNATIELAGVDKVLHNTAADILCAVEKELREVFEECQQLGEIDTDRKPELLAQTFFVALQGLHVSCRQGATRAEIKKSVDELLSMYGAKT